MISSSCLIMPTPPPLMCLPLGTHVSEKKHQSNGGNPYSKEFCQVVIKLYNTGGWAVLCTPEYNELQAQQRFPCKATCKSWIRLEEQNGNIFPKRAMGKKFSEQEIQVEDLFNLTLYQMMHPQAYIDEVCAYVHNMNPNNPSYSRSQIVWAEQKLCLLRKVGSSTSNKAYHPINLLKQQRYGQLPYPYGVVREDINSPGQSFCLTMDNQNIHKHPVVIQLIKEAGHCIVFCAPYWSCNGAIEYVFNTIHTLLQMLTEGIGSRTVEELIDKVDNIIHQLKIVSFKA